MPQMCRSYRRSDAHSPITMRAPSCRCVADELDQANGVVTDVSEHHSPTCTAHREPRGGGCVTLAETTEGFPA